ncbi:MAG TPA: hypothetical protein VGH28_13925 [Polyangiaceae bacterium]|jgi:hypothetical protein
MTDRVKGCWVAFDCDIRTDDVEPLLNAIRHLRHVQAVTTSVRDPDDWMNRERIRRELGEEILNVLRENRETK